MVNRAVGIQQVAEREDFVGFNVKFKPIELQNIDEAVTHGDAPLKAVIITAISVENFVNRSTGLQRVAERCEGFAADRACFGRIIDDFIDAIARITCESLENGVGTCQLAALGANPKLFTDKIFEGDAADHKAGFLEYALTRPRIAGFDANIKRAGVDTGIATRFADAIGHKAARQHIITCDAECIQDDGFIIGEIEEHAEDIVGGGNRDQNTTFTLE